MRRLLKLKTPVLALILSVTAEVLSFVVALLTPSANQPDDPVLAIRFIHWFHHLPDLLGWKFVLLFKPFHDNGTFEATLDVVIALFAVAQWYLIFVIGIGLFRRFVRKKS